MPMRPGEDEEVGFAHFLAHFLLTARGCGLSFKSKGDRYSNEILCDLEGVFAIGIYDYVHPSARALTDSQLQEYFSEFPTTRLISTALAIPTHFRRAIIAS
ncbi:MAG: hypothetical protein E7182_03670 [Erysipelotrichaceae bacterium]|nr:hypothetical protein [Erysipelotrichaceae bacterium]